MRAIPLLLLVLIAVALPASPQMDDVVIEATQLSDSLHMLTGRGGNIVVSAGEDGIFLVDDQYAPLTERILAAVAEIQTGDVRFVLNTHWHGDHTGGNENLGKTGSVIVAHENVRERMSVAQFNELWDRETEASPEAALPVVTFRSGVTFHLNEETLEVSHIEHAHTDGDAIVRFIEANIIHTGDVVFWGLYPFIDVDSGGSIDGVIAGCDRLSEMADADTRFVPGHGTMFGPDELAQYRAMLVDVRTRVSDMIEEGMDLEAVQAAAPTAEYDEGWGQMWLDGQTFTKTVFNSLSQKK
jgi:glyoxylase-like metal-dependent hydrolase (beta-lactamase superfamily II)